MRSCRPSSSIARSAAQPADDAARIGASLRNGRTYSIVRAFAGPAVLDFSADQAAGHDADGRPVDGHGADGPRTRLSLACPTRSVVLMHGGSVLARGKGRVEVSSPPSPGAYRVEVYYPGFSVPWIVSNPIYADLPTAPPAVAPRRSHRARRCR